MVVKINNRQFERRREKKGQYLTNKTAVRTAHTQGFGNQANIGRARQLTTAHGSHSGPMELGLRQRMPKPQKDNGWSPVKEHPKRQLNNTSEQDATPPIYRTHPCLGQRAITRHALSTRIARMARDGTPSNPQRRKLSG